MEYAETDALTGDQFKDKPVLLVPVLKRRNSFKQLAHSRRNSITGK